MDQRTNQIFFALLRSAICGGKLTEQERDLYAPEQLRDLLQLSARHDLVHLVALGLKQNELIAQEEHAEVEKCIFKAVYRYERARYEYENLCAALEQAQIPFLPLKGAVIRQYYPEAWMRTSCDIDILVRREDLDRAVAYLLQQHGYTEGERAPHDVSLFTQSGIHIELHFDLVEEGRANDAIDILRSVWDNATLRKDCEYWYEMSDAFFYFYHVAHMAKHFESGGCGVRPFIDLWILDHRKDIDLSACDALLARGNLLRFAEVSRTLSEMWFGASEPNDLLMQMQRFILYGGVYGTVDNRVALQQKKKGGRLGYILSRMFIPYEKLKRYYPVLEKHRYLMPLMQVRRWFMLLRPDVAKMAKQEMAANGNLTKARSDKMNTLLDQIGLN